MLKGSNVCFLENNIYSFYYKREGLDGTIKEHCRILVSKGLYNSNSSLYL